MKEYLLFLSALFLAYTASSQDYAKSTSKGTFTREQMSKHWMNLSKDKGFTELGKAIKAKGFEKLEEETSAYGFEGTYTDPSGKATKVAFYAYDFKNKNAKKGQGGSLIWRQIGDKVYKAYIIFPEGEKDINKALEGATEWYADKEGKVQRAHSWNTCFLSCVKSNGSAPSIDMDIRTGKVSIGSKTYTLNCTAQCFTGAIVCSGIAGVIAVAGAAESGGVSVPFAIAVFATCAGLTCGSCVALCGIGCM
jgi:hypothetical protein